MMTQVANLLSVVSELYHHGDVQQCQLSDSIHEDAVTWGAWCLQPLCGSAHGPVISCGQGWDSRLCNTARC